VAGRFWNGSGSGNPDRFEWNAGYRSIEPADVNNPAIGRIGNGIGIGWRYEFRSVDQSPDGSAIAGRNPEHRNASAKHDGIGARRFLGAGQFLGGQRLCGRVLQHALLILGAFNGRRTECREPGRRYFNEWLLEHDPEKWKPVFRKDHAQTIDQSGMTIRR
jgi:hypothetical protein